ncbi:TonB-dependent receptor [Methylophaga lonarensis MPL]|uniref:TonB-dependent receptor n=2 Tax=Methylophaga lonarensis TaxID=999151 RepID=M7PGF8_9GAMM|nr:TonB-dependent receptor [Methylophaga lonarensis]EMR12975.1 TonB-dependent receptor [Methylophaga lonarensis MPL]
MKLRTLSAIMITASSAIPAVVNADDDAVLRSPDTILVIGSRPDYATTHLAGSHDVISREELAQLHIDNTMELFTKVPGVYFARYNQGIINTDIGIRGFAAEGSTPHAKLLIDGIPANLHNGYSEMDQLFPQNIDSVQVFKGNSDPRYGAFNVAGNYNITTRSDVGRMVEATVGSFNARELQAYWGEQSGALQHSYFAGYRKSGGYRDNFDVEKYSVSGRWFYDLSDLTTLGFIARVAGYDADAPGYLPRDEARRHPRRSAAYARQDGGDKSQQSYSLHFDTALSDQLDWSVKAYYNTYERERWVRFSEAGSLQNRYDDQLHKGFISTLVWDINDQWAMTWGVDMDYQNVVEQRFGTIDNRRARDTSAVSRNFRYNFNTKGSYLQLSHSPNQYIDWNAAVRVDRLNGSFNQRDAAGVKTSRSIYDFGSIVQPKLNLFVHPTDTVTLFANYGRSFQHPFGADAYTTGDRNARDVSINDGWELGVMWAMTADVDLRVSYWQQAAKDEFVVVDGTPRNVGKTLRKGTDVGVNWQINPALLLWGNMSFIDSEIRTSADGNKGNSLRSIPDYVGSMGLNYLVTPKLTSRLHVHTQGGSYVNEQNRGGKFGQYTLVDLSLDYDTGWGNINFQVNNLFNRYYEYVYDFGDSGSPVDTIHSPGDGINASVSVLYRF